MSLDNFVDSLSMKKIGIKVLLLDQSSISGVGNWIADEVLYQLSIQKFVRPASKAALELRFCYGPGNVWVLGRRVGHLPLIARGLIVQEGKEP